jgi:hypothetical protein
MPEAAKPVAMLGLIERLDHVRAVGLDPGRGDRVHQARLVQLAREAGRTTVQHVAGYERQRRHAIFVPRLAPSAPGSASPAAARRSRSWKAVECIIYDVVRCMLINATIH